MIDEQTRRSIETMCLCGLSIEELKRCFPKVDENILVEVYKCSKIENDN